jgi:acyl carrier protein
MNEKIIAILEKIRPGVSDDLTARFVTDEILDSLDVMNIIVALEDAFNIELDPEEVVIDNFESVEAIATFVAKHKEGGN